MLNVTLTHVIQPSLGNLSFFEHAIRIKTGII